MPTCRRGTGTPWAAWCSTCSGTFRPRGSRSRPTATGWWRRRCRAGASAACGSCPWTVPAPGLPIPMPDHIPRRVPYAPPPPPGGAPAPPAAVDNPRRVPYAPPPPPGGAAVRSGFVALVGRPNVGKSTLLNAILGTKVSIVSDKPQTTRTRVVGVLNGPDSQVIVVDTPGLHKPRGPLGRHLNETASDAAGGVDVVVLVVDGAGGIGSGDRYVAATVPPGLVVVNKI